jgi:hypothetical protein
LEADCGDVLQLPDEIRAVQRHQQAGQHFAFGFQKKVYQYGWPD